MTATRQTKSLQSATNATLYAELSAGRPATVMWDDFNRALFVRTSSGTVPLDQEAITKIAEQLETAISLRVNRAELKHVLSRVGKENKFDSADEWLDALPAWDRVPRVEDFFATYFKAVPNRYHRAVGRYFWTAMVARIRVPGCKADMVPILIGRQGVGKSTALAVIAPTPHHFCGDASLADRDALLARKVVGKTLVDWEEMRGIRGRCEADDVKTFITLNYTESRSQDTSGFDRFPRRFIIVGTSNRSDVLRDPTGNRRYLPIDIRGQISLDQLRADKKQLWAEALHTVQELSCQGEDIVDFREAELLAPSEHRAFLNEARWRGERNLTHWLAGGADKFTTEDALNTVGLTSAAITPRDKRDMDETLKQLGYDCRPSRVPGYEHNQRRWRPSKASAVEMLP